MPPVNNSTPLSSPDLTEMMLGLKDGFLVLDQDWRIRFINQTAVRAGAGGDGGRDPRELVGQNLWEAFPGLAGTRLEALYRAAMQNREPAFLEMESHAAEGWEVVNVYPVSGGIAVYQVSHLRAKAAAAEEAAAVDEVAAAEAKAEAEEARSRQALEQANAALRVSEERIKIAQEAAEIGVWDWDLRTNQMWWSPQSYEIFGVPPGQPLMLETSMARILPEDVSAVSDQLQAAIFNRKDFRAEYRIRHPERGLRWVEGFARILYGADGLASRMVGTSRDITRRKEMEENLRQSLERERSRAAELAAIMDAVPAYVFFSHDPNSRSIDGNRAAHDLLRLGQGANLSKTAPENQAPQSYQLIRAGQEIPPAEMPVQVAAARGIAVRDYELSVAFADGQQINLIGNATPLFDVNGRPAGAVAAFIDVTGQKETAEELRRLNAELEQRVADQAISQQKLLKLIEVSNRVVAAQSVPNMLQELVDAALELTEARAGVCGQGFENGKFQVWKTANAPGIDPFPASQVFAVNRGGVYLDLITGAPSLRLTQDELERQPAWWGLPQEHVRLRGLLGARLNGVEPGKGPTGGAEPGPVGMIMVTDRARGDFTTEDETLLIQLARLASWSLWQIRQREAAELAAREASRQAAQAEESQRILESLMEYVPEGITIAEGRDALIRMVSRYGREILGRANVQLTAEQVVGEWKVFAEDGQTPLPVEQLPLLRAVRKGEVVINQQVVQVNAAGLPLHLSCNAGPIRDRSGAIIGAVVAWRDVTELRQAREDLRRSEARFRVAMAGMPMTMFTLDRSLRYSWLHNQLPGVHEKNILGRRNQDLGSPDRLAWLTALQRSVIDTGLGVQQEMEIKARGQAITYLVTLEPMLNAGGEVTGITGALLDVSREKHLEAQQREYATQMEEQRGLLENREKERQSIARDLNDGVIQELTGTLFNLQMLKQAYADPALKGQLEQVGLRLKKSIQDLREIINDLRPPSLLRLGLTRAIQVHAADFQEHHPEITLYLEIAGEGEPDSEQARLALFRIYQEAMNNVARHSQASAAWVRFASGPVGTVMEIQDNGKGFAVPADLSTLVDTGHFGLAGMKERAEAVSGKLEIESAEGRGTKLRVVVK